MPAGKVLPLPLLHMRYRALLVLLQQCSTCAHPARHWKIIHLVGEVIPVASVALVIAVRDGRGAPRAAALRRAAAAAAACMPSKHVKTKTHPACSSLRLHCGALGVSTPVAGMVHRVAAPGVDYSAAPKYFAADTAARTKHVVKCAEAWRPVQGAALRRAAAATAACIPCRLGAWAAEATCCAAVATATLAILFLQI